MAVLITKERPSIGDGVKEWTCLSSDTKPTSAISGDIIRETDTSNKFEYDGNSWVQISTAGAGHVTTGGAAKNQITPTVGGTNTAAITLSAGTGGSPAITTIIKLLVTIDTMDDVEAGTNLTNEYPDVFTVHPGETIEIPSPDTAITRVSCIAIITGTLGTTAGTNVLTKLAGSAEAVVAAGLRTFTFLQSDDVRVVNVGITDNGTEADSEVFVEGFSNA